MLADYHTHAYMLPKRDLELMSLAGLTDVIVCSFLPLVKHPETLADHYEELFSIHIGRMEELGIKAHVFVGIHPRCIPPEWKKLLPIIEGYLESGKAAGVGEVGLDGLTKTEEEVLTEQIRIAKEYDVPVIIHVPMNERLKVVEKVVYITRKAGLDFGKLVIDHTADDTIDIINECNAIPGLSVKPPLLNPAKIVENIDKYRNGVLNSDCASLTDTDPLAVPKTAKYLARAGVEKKIVDALSHRNALNILKG